ncbi:MAG: prephenate dehydratase, partial [Flavobacteriaceae bacterium]|nr:prephenate dehydratase [Flavobacteriaceae bacterium]
AIASKEAAKLFDLEVLANDIQTIKYNSTRFFILKKEKSNKIGRIQNKSSIKFITKHETGNLAEVLDIFAKNNISLTKIQSLPKIDEPWKYAFFIDLVFDNKTLYDNALHLINKKVTHLKILGEYQQNNIEK